LTLPHVAVQSHL